MSSMINAASRQRRPARLVAGVLGLALVAGPVPALAQDANAEARLRKVEAEIRALQRKVFPGGDGRYFEPEITAPAATAATPAPGTPSTGVLTDVLARLEALERQLQSLTAQTEVNGNAVTQLSERVEALEAANRAQAEAQAATAANAPADAGIGSTGGTVPATGAGAPSAQPAPTPTASAPSAQRLAAVQAIAKPSTSDAADDEYVYGFRLYDARFYPEAQQQLTMFVNANPRHWRATYGRNLLGRAYLDDNKPRDAAAWFLNNYQADKTAARAGDSLLGLAQAMIALKDTSRACVALAEFGDTYPALATGRLKNDYDAARRQVQCG